MLLSPLILILFILTCHAQKKDMDSRCKEWAQMGECDKNPNYMRVSCQTACEIWDRKMGIENMEDIQNINSFFELSADDIDGNEFRFENLAGKVTIIVNVASYCGYTESHYRGLVSLWELVKQTNKVEILAFPSNQFGHQEPDTCQQIKHFAAKKNVEFKMMYKVDVNGNDAHEVYKYLKMKAGPKQIGWNFATYFLVAPDGSVRSYSGIEPLQLKDLIFELLENEL